ncbi:SRPBCC family protein [Fictibacillus nanhaiensis]|uniref:SRPBCC family protein n=1 Tax=Fictibacillus nanhaiensis TaxID=742169 RepID=UPI00203E8860|nr:SRPBCC family protein [Fictibacillus nanhaiensis]MCM3730444.1 SRPBCC family protein [Fictibacillus nanhaiensis]
MVNVVTDIIINCPCEKAAQFAANPDHAPDWYVNIKSAEWQTEKTIKVGSKMAFIAEFLGRRLEYVYEIVDYIPGQKLVMKTADGPFPMETTYTWDSINENQTKMTLRNKGVPSGFSKIFAPFMSLLMKRANKKDLIKIKGILEK